MSSHIAPDELLTWVKQHGREAFCWRALRSEFAIEQYPEGLVPYVDIAGTKLVLGSPIGDAADISRLQRAFETNHKRVVYFGRELPSDAALPDDAYCVGAQPWWLVSQWPNKVASHAKIRAQLARSRNKQVEVSLCDAETWQNNRDLHQQLTRIGAQWQSRHRMPPMMFVVELDLFSYPTERRLFVAKQQGRVVGALVASPIPARNAWILEHVIRGDEAPNGTMELLIHHAMLQLAQEGASQVTLGLCALFYRAPWWQRLARKLGRHWYDFEGLYRFKSKLMPDFWEQIIVEYPRQNKWIATWRTLRAFAGGSFFRFLLRKTPTQLAASTADNHRDN